jgi:cytochrome c-type biogenesis protein CcmE
MKVSPNTLRISIAVAVILGTIAWLAFTGYGSSKSYYVTIAQLGVMGDKAYHSNLRVEGFVEPRLDRAQGPARRIRIERIRKPLA